MNVVNQHEGTYWLVLMRMLRLMSSLQGTKLRLNTMNSIISKNFTYNKVEVEHDELHHLKELHLQQS